MKQNTHKKQDVYKRQVFKASWVFLVISGNTIMVRVRAPVRME